uniref:SPIN-DOC-like zinc-finger domain-containing protein n=2 Tax=Nothobranchius TaxID=28779 RepID=A0A1A8V9L8_NOTFU
MAEKRKKTYNFHSDWEEEFFFTLVREKCVCLICGMTVATAKRHNVERHFSTCHKSYNASYPPSSALRTEKARELKAALGKQPSLFKKPVEKSQKTTEASFRATHFLIKNKKTFSDGEVFKEAMMIIAKTVFKDEKNGTDVISTLQRPTGRKYNGKKSDGYVRELNRAAATGFGNMHPTTTRGVDIYNAVKSFLVEKKVPLEKLVSMTTDGAPAMIGRHAGFIAHCKGDTDFPTFLHYHCIIHQQAICSKVTGFEHVMTPVVKIINSIRSKAKQHRIFKVLLEELSAEYGDLLQKSDGSAGDGFCNVFFFHFCVKSRSSCNPKSVLNDHASASETYDKVVDKYSEVINRLGQEFENRFRDFDQLEPSPRDFYLKANQSESNFWCLVDTEKYKGVCTAAMKVACMFGSTYLCESAFSDMNFIKSKHRTRLTDAHLHNSVRVAVSSYTPDYSKLVNSMQCQVSH